MSPKNLFLQYVCLRLNRMSVYGQVIHSRILGMKSDTKVFICRNGVSKSAELIFMVQFKDLITIGFYKTTLGILPILWFFQRQVGITIKQDFQFSLSASP